MLYQALHTPHNHWLEPATLRLKRIMERQPTLRLVTLGLLNVISGLLLLSPAIILTCTSLAALWLYGHVHGPLDWFIIEILGVLALVSGWVTLQQYLTRPRQPEGIVLNAQQSAELNRSLAHRAHAIINEQNHARLNEDDHERRVSA